MTIAAASPSQVASNYASGVSSLTVVYPNNVAVGDLLTIVVSTAAAAAPHTIASTDLVKSAGTATIGTVTLDETAQILFAGTYPATVSQFSALVTGAGSLTLQFTAPASSSIWIGVDEYTGSFGSDRVEDTAPATGTSAAAASGDVTSSAGGVIVGGTCFYSGAAVDPTQDGAFTLLAERSADAANLGASAIRRLLATGATDSADWSLSASATWAATAVVYREAAASPPTAPTAQDATDVGVETATANWTDNSGDETGFEIESAPGPGFSVWTPQGTAAANATSKAMTGLAQGTAHKHRVRAVNGAGNSSWSVSDEFTTGSYSYSRPAFDVSNTGWTRVEAA